VWWYVWYTQSRKCENYSESDELKVGSVIRYMFSVQVVVTENWRNPVVDSAYIFIPSQRYRTPTLGLGLCVEMGMGTSEGPRVDVLFCSLTILNPRVGHTMDVLSPFIPVLCHSDWLFHGESCPRLDVVHPGRAWSSSPACTWHCSLHYLFLQATPLFPRGVTIVASLFALTVSNSSLFTPALLRTHSFACFAVYKTHRIFFSSFISKASGRVSLFFLSAQLSQHTLLQATLVRAFISREYNMQLWIHNCIFV